MSENIPLIGGTAQQYSTPEMHYFAVQWTGTNLAEVSNFIEGFSYRIQSMEDESWRQFEKSRVLAMGTPAYIMVLSVPHLGKSLQIGEWITIGPSRNANVIPVAAPMVIMSHQAFASTMEI